MSLYATLLLASIAVPFGLSFDRKLRFYTLWKKLFPAILLMAVPFVLFDVYFTNQGHWGFNPQYHSDLKIWGLPLEELLFFILIPYASLFLHYSFILYFPRVRLSEKMATILAYIFIIALIIIAIIYHQKAYTFYTAIQTSIILGLGLWFNRSILQSFFVTFLLILIPFLIVNGILTGSFIEGEVVWYNNVENLGIRLFTIPIEDITYGFTLIFGSLLLISGKSYPRES